MLELLYLLQIAIIKVWDKLYIFNIIYTVGWCSSFHFFNICTEAEETVKNKQRKDKEQDKGQHRDFFKAKNILIMIPRGY